MDINSYIKQYHNGNQSEFAKKSGIKPMAISRYCRGERKPDSVNLEKIRLATDGKVTFDDFYDKATA